MSKETIFFIYLLERFSQYKGKAAYEVLGQWNALGLTDFIYNMYEIYHSERLQNAFDDIDILVNETAAAKGQSAPKSENSSKIQ